jgi:hypothetical protein
MKRPTPIVPNDSAEGTILSLGATAQSAGSRSRCTRAAFNSDINSHQRP